MSENQADRFPELMLKIKRLATSLERHVVPIFALNALMRPQSVGTAFLVRKRFRDYLVTAAHVLDDPKDRRARFVYCGPSSILELGRALIAKDLLGRKGNITDTAILRLSSVAVAHMAQINKMPVDFSALMPNCFPRSFKRYFVIGYPASKSGLRARRIVTQPACIYARAVDETWCRNGALDSSRRIFLEFSKKHQYCASGFRQSRIALRGMSGSPVFLAYDEKAPNDIKMTPVVGIFTDFKKEGSVMIASDIQIAVDLIEQMDLAPTEREPLAVRAPLR